MASIVSATAAARLQHPIPLDLARLLPNRETPWSFSQELFDRIRKQENSADKSFTTCEVLKEDPEFQFVFRYFFNHKPPGLSIRKIVCVHNPHQTRGFEAALPGMEKAAQQFRPAWDNEEPKVLRAKTSQRWEEQTHQFSPFSVQVEDTRKDRYVHVKVLPLWHGTKHVESICEIGFTCFGKHHMLHPSAGASAGPGPGAQKSTDIGYFGSGIYFTNSARYAAMYNRGTLLLSWVAMRRPYPVVSDAPLPQKCSDMRKLEGQGAYQNSNAHFIPVVSIDPNDPECMEYHPCSQADQPVFDEFVVFQSTQALPRFCIELGVDLPAAPPQVPMHLLQSADAALKSGDIEAIRKLLAEIGSDQERNALLLLAARAGDVGLFLMILKTGASPSAVNEKGRNALHIAAGKGNIAVVQLLSASKALLETRDEDGRTPLLLAAYRGHGAICEALLKAGANSEAVDDDDYNALHLAAKRGKVEVVQVLFGYKIDLSARNSSERTAFLMAASRGHRQMCQLLLAHGARHCRNENYYKCSDKHQNTPLHLAAREGKVEMVPMLVESWKESLELTNRNGRTPLLEAARYGHSDVCEALLRAGANPRATVGSIRWNALHLAIESGELAVVRIFLAYKELLKARSYFGTPLHWAITKKQSEVVPLLLAEGREALEVCDHEGLTPFLSAISVGDCRIAEMLLKAGASPTPVDIIGMNALHWAAFRGDLGAMQMLLAYKELLEVRSPDGLTPLLRAASTGQQEAFEALLKAGANPTVVSREGLNALHWAARSGLPGGVAIIQQLMDHRELIDQRTQAGDTPFLYAASTSSRAACEALLSAGANPRAVGSFGQNALHRAAQSSVEVVKMLVAQYRDLLAARDQEGKTPLDLAADRLQEAKMRARDSAIEPYITWEKTAQEIYDTLT